MKRTSNGSRLKIGGRREATLETGPERPYDTIDSDRFRAGKTVFAGALRPIHRCAFFHRTVTDGRNRSRLQAGHSTAGGTFPRPESQIYATSSFRRLIKEMRCSGRSHRPTQIATHHLSTITCSCGTINGVHDSGALSYLPAHNLVNTVTGDLSSLFLLFQ